MVCLAKEKRFAPLRPEIFSAKTVFLSGGPPDVLDKAYGELTKWNRFQMVSTPQEVDLILEIVYNRSSAGALGVTDTETLTLRDGKTREVLYSDSREHSTGGGAVGFFTGLRSMSLSMLKDLRKRIEATESARTFEYTIQFETRAAKYFTDAAALDEKLVTLWPSADSLKSNAMKWKEFAEQLSRSKSEMTQFLARATADDLLRKDNAVGVKKHWDDILAYTCSQLALAKDIDRLLETARADLSPDVVRALDEEKSDAAALSPDCSSELAISLMKERAGKPRSN